MVIESKYIDTEKKTASLTLRTYDEFEIQLHISLDSFNSITESDLIDCAKIAYNNLSTFGDGDKCETAVNLEGNYIYMTCVKYADWIEIDSIRKLSEYDFNLFIQYQAANQNLN